MRKLTNLVVLGLLAVPMTVACSSNQGSNSALADSQNDDLESLREYALNESGKDYFSQGIRDVLGTRLDGEKFPYFDRRKIKIDVLFGQIEEDVTATGESWVVNPKETLAVRLENMVRVEGSVSDWTFELAGRAPARGSVKVNTPALGLGDVVDTFYSANINVRFYGKLHYEPVYDEALDESIIDIKASVHDMKSEITDLQFDTGLITIINDVVQDQVNHALDGAKANLLQQTNTSVSEAQSRGELRAKFNEFFSIFPVSGG